MFEMNFPEITVQFASEPEIPDFGLNGSRPQFTKEIEENGKITFLNCLDSRDNNRLRTTIYGNLTHTDRLLDESSYNPTSLKVSTIQTLTKQAQLV